jgi:integrase
MSRPRNPVPTYRLHSPTGRAVVTVYDPDGRSRELYLGRHGTAESRAQYARVLAELLPGCVHLGAAADATVGDVILAFWKHAEVYYRSADGKPTSEQSEIRRALKVLRELYGDRPASEFGPKSLAVVRQHMIGLGWCRPLVNKRVDRIKRALKWAVAEELVPPSVYEGLRALAGLKAGRSAAREPAPVAPVPVADYAATLSLLPRMPRAIAMLMRHAGMRPGEACRLTMGEVDTSGEVWVYRPSSHKTRHHGRDRVIPLGPRAQLVLLEFFGPLARYGLLPASPYVPVFCAAREQALRFAERRSKRKTRVQPSQRCRRKKTPQRTPKGGYGPHALAHAVAVAAKKAGVSHWHPNQIRHLVATEVRERFGLEAAQVVLGHSRADVTQTYAERDQGLAAKVAGEVG